MVIQHNLQAMFTNRQLGITGGGKSKSQEKLASGYKINRAADNAAGLAISEKMRKKVRGLDRGAENIKDGISLAQVADGALNETHDMLQRMNELAIQAANGTNSESDRHAIQAEINQLKMEIDRVSETTSFNQTIFPLKGESGHFITEIVPSSIKPAVWDPSLAKSIALDYAVAYEDMVDENETNIFLEAFKSNIIEDNDSMSYDREGNPRGSTTASGYVYSQINHENNSLEIYGAKDNKMICDVKYYDEVMDPESAGKYRKVIPDQFEGHHPYPLYDSYYQEGLSTPAKMSLYGDDGEVLLSKDVSGMLFNFEVGIRGAESHSIEDVNILLACNKILFMVDHDSWGGIHDSWSIGATRKVDEDGAQRYNAIHSGKYNEVERWVGKGKDLKIQNSDEASDWTPIHAVDASCKGIGVQDVNVLSADLATNSIDMIAYGIKKVSEYRSYFGAMQNRFEHARAINLNSSENTTAAESRIRDTDMAKEMQRYSTFNILEQAGQSMLSQANQSTNGVMSLLQG